ncbi:hypothetical protein LTS18_008259, partial [Coniosporium uncinatum]
TSATAAKDTIDVVPKRVATRSFDQPTASSKAKNAGAAVLKEKENGKEGAGAGGEKKEHVKTARSGRKKI